MVSVAQVAPELVGVDQVHNNVDFRLRDNKVMSFLVPVTSVVQQYVFDHKVGRRKYGCFSLLTASTWPQQCLRHLPSVFSQNVFPCQPVEATQRVSRRVELTFGFGFYSTVFLFTVPCPHSPLV